MAHRGWVFCIPRHSAGPLERRRATAHTTLLGLLGHPVTLIRSLGHFRIPVPRDCLPWMRHYARSNTASAAYRKCYFVLWFRSIRNQARLHGVDNANTKLLRGRAGQVGLAAGWQIPASWVALSPDAAWSDSPPVHLQLSCNPRATSGPLQRTWRRAVRSGIVLCPTRPRRSHR